MCTCGTNPGYPCEAFGFPLRVDARRDVEFQILRAQGDWRMLLPAALGILRGASEIKCRRMLVIGGHMHTPYVCLAGRGRETVLRGASQCEGGCGRA